MFAVGKCQFLPCTAIESEIFLTSCYCTSLLTCRLFFFTGCEGDGKHDTLKEVIHSDKKAVQSLRSVLRISDEDFDVDMLIRIAFDLNDRPQK